MRRSQVGDTILSVGMLPQMAAYKSYIVEASVSALLRGEIAAGVGERRRACRRRLAGV